MVARERVVARDVAEVAEAVRAARAAGEGLRVAGSGGSKRHHLGALSDGRIIQVESYSANS